MEKYAHFSANRSERINHSRAVKPYNTRIDVFRYSFFPDVIEMWNALPDVVVDQTDVHKFECSIDILYRGHPT